jgi:predicted O-linked N-acetylglucosamine transferase (SPINDLY family)
MQLDPRSLQAALEHYRAGRWDEAESLCRRILEIEAGNTDALLLLHQIGIALKSLGRLEEAARSFRVVLEAQPGFADAYNNLGNALQGLGRLQEAEASYRKALALAPDHVAVHGNLGVALQRLGRFPEAEEHIRRALALKADSAEAHNQLGNLLQQLGRYSESERALRVALALEPDHAEAQNNLGIVLSQTGRNEDAEQCFQKVLALKPDSAEAYSNFGVVLQRLGRYGEAEQRCRKAIAIAPDDASAHFNLAQLLQRVGRIVEAEQSYRDALIRKSGYVEAYAHWLHVCQSLCLWSGEQDLAIRELRELVVRGKSNKVQPFIFLALPGTDASEQHQCAQQFASRAFAEFLSRSPICDAEPRSRRARLRIGYLSGDYREHAASHLLAGIIERHDRHRFEVIGYSYGRDDGSAIGRRIRAAFGTLHDVRPLSDESVARKIFDDGIDILVELAGYTQDNRMQIAALRPAPVQVSWVGFPATLGNARLADYLIGDPISTPLENASAYAETLALLPHCYQPNDRERPMGAKPGREQVGLPPDAFVFCCFNQSYKITPGMFSLWCRLLIEVPGSVLWLVGTSLATESNLKREASARGVAAERLIFAPTKPLADHLARLQLADLALDTFPYTSHTTASDALWAGVPLVTLIGQTQVSRLAASICNAAGLPELVARDPDSYFRLALELATQPERLRTLRAKIAANRLTCPLFDSARFVRDLERIYDGMWTAYQAGTKRPTWPE